MGLFDSFADFNIKTDVRDRAIFFPWAPFGKGYVVPDREALRDLRRELGRLGLIVTALLMITLPIHPLLAAAAFIFTSIIYALWARDEIRYWRVADEKMSGAESFNNGIRNLHPVFTLIPFLLWLPVTAFNIDEIINNHPAADPGFTALSAMITALLGLMLYKNLRARKK
jgi:hypothetical protein